MLRDQAPEDRTRFSVTDTPSLYCGIVSSTYATSRELASGRNLVSSVADQVDNAHVMQAVRATDGERGQQESEHLSR